MAEHPTRRRDSTAESAMTIREAAAVLGRSTESVYQLIITGRLVGARKQSGRWLIPPCVIRAYVRGDSATGITAAAGSTGSAAQGVVR